MFRALSVRRNNHHGYDLLGVDSSSSSLSSSPPPPADAKLTRAISVPARILWGSSSSKSKKPVPEGSALSSSKSSSSKKKSSSKRYNHPLLSLFDVRWRRKKPTTAKPEFARYLEYVKEGGVWDKNTDMPVIYYK